MTDPLSGLGDDESLAVTGTAGVAPAGGAVALRGHDSEPAPADPPACRAARPGYLDRPAPARRCPRWPRAPGRHRGGLCVPPAGRAAARRAARHRVDQSAPLVQRAQAGHLDRLSPAAVPLDGHEPLGVTMVRVEPA